MNALEERNPEIEVKWKKLRNAIRKADLRIVGEIYRDDSELCVDVGIKLKGGNKEYIVECRWIGVEFVAEVIYMCKGPQYQSERDSFAEYIDGCIVEMVNDCYVYDDPADLTDGMNDLIEFVRKFEKK